MVITTYRPLAYMMRWPNGHYNISASNYMMRWPNGHYNISASNLHDEVAK